MNLIIERGCTKIDFFLIERYSSLSKHSIPITNPEDLKKHVATKFREESITKIIFVYFGTICLSDSK